MKTWKDSRFNPFDWFERWEKLLPETKQLFLKEIGSDLKVDPQLFSEATRRELLQAGFILPDKLRLVDPVRPFRNLVRSMGWHRHFEPTEADLSVDYVSDHLTTYECSDLPALAGSRHFGRDAGIAAKEVVESSWLKAFLNCKSVKTWEGSPSIHSQHYFTNESFELLHRWVERMLAGENPLPLSALLEEAGGDVGLAADALRGGIRYLILFPALSGKELRPVVGVWPAIHARMNRPAALTPKAGPLPAGFQVYNVPLLLHDMTTVLVAASGEGLRLKSGGSGLFKKELETVEAQISADPPAGCGYKPPYLGRVQYACSWLHEIKLATVSSRSKKLRLAVSAKGREWLAESEDVRLKTLHDYLIAVRKRHANRELTYHETPFVPYNPQSYVYKGQANVEDFVADVFAECPVGEWLDLKHFLSWQAEVKNPFMSSLDDSIIRIFSGRWNSSDEYREERWRDVLTTFIYYRLMILGGANVAFNDQGDIRFSLTPAGAYLVGARDDFAYAVEAPVGTVLVQPDFEIIFTAPNPHAESGLAHFSERIGNGVGALFKMTRASVLQALNAGQTGEQILAALEMHCEAGVPANVRKQIQGWSDSFRCVAIRQVQVIDCPDAETASLVCGLFTRKVSRLTDTLVQISGGGQSIGPIKKKLRENGIGIT